MNGLSHKYSGYFNSIIPVKIIRNTTAVDEFVSCGSRMAGPLADIVSDTYPWIHEQPDWWAVVHATYILGAIATEETVLPLLKALRLSSVYDCDWVTGNLPSIFGKVGAKAMTGLKHIASDRTTDWYTRALSLESLAAITISNQEPEKEIFDFIGSILNDAEEDRDIRGSAAYILLDFLRDEFKDALVLFGKEERAMHDKEINPAPIFFDTKVEKAFASKNKRLHLYTKKWLEFYTEEEIKKRQERWEREKQDEQEIDKDHDEEIFDPTSDPFNDDIPKIWRNAPCPCGSGKKQKKCCGMVH